MERKVTTHDAISSLAMIVTQQQVLIDMLHKRVSAIEEAQCDDPEHNEHAEAVNAIFSMAASAMMEGIVEAIKETEDMEARSFAQEPSIHPGPIKDYAEN